MRLYVNGISKNKIGYIPDWLQVSYTENGQNKDLTLDIQGEIDYDNDSLNCRCKGNLVPWTLVTYNPDNEIDLSKASEDGVEKNFSEMQILNILRQGKEFRVGIYPTDDSHAVLSQAKTDVLFDCTGSCEFYNREMDTFSSVYFSFETEFNG